MAGTNQTNQYLTFTIDKEKYAIPVTKVREVLEYPKITKIPKTASFMKGVFSLRGMSVPVISLRLKFGMEESDITKETSIIVLEIDSKEGPVIIGALADSVQEVIELDAKQIEPPPKFGTRLAADFLLGMGKRGDNFLILLDIDKIFNSTEVLEMEGIKETPVPQEQS